MKGSEWSNLAFFSQVVSGSCNFSPLLRDEIWEWPGNEAWSNLKRDHVLGTPTSFPSLATRSDFYTYMMSCILYAH